MCPYPDDDEWIQAASSAVEEAASRFSPLDRFDSPEPWDLALRVADLRAQQQRCQQLSQYCDEAVAAIRASLERTPDKGGERDERG